MEENKKSTPATTRVEKTELIDEVLFRQLDILTKRCESIDIQNDELAILNKEIMSISNFLTK